LGDGTGAFSAAPGQIPAGFGNGFGREVALGDADGDADLDAMYGVSCTGMPICVGGQERLLLNDGTGVFSMAPAQPPAWNDSTTSLVLGDVDGDGDLDALAGNTGLCGRVGACGIGVNRLYLNDGSGAFSDATGNLPALAAWTESVFLGDVDGDADLDAVIGCKTALGQMTRLLLNDGTGNYEDVTTRSPVMPGTLASSVAAAADLDGDGDLDAFVGTSGPLMFPPLGTDRVLLNDGGGGLEEAAVQPPYSGTAHASPADVDGDGDLDMLVGTNGPPGLPNLLLLYVNGGVGNLAAGGGCLPSQVGGILGADFGDVDGDGDLDALLARAPVLPGLPPLRLLLHVAAGVFTDATSQLPTGSFTARAVALGDLDGDGDLDALVGNSGPCSSPASCTSPEQNRLYLNSGSGVFSDATPLLPQVLDATFAIALGD
ncbi:MAG TPA: VCBS repeat-containing protein, partial [Planctomycetota bacterium]|nr:VCBS repeat-containing protein [Planctomycetota bacterium]